MREVVIGQYTIQIEEVYDNDNELMHYKVHSPLFDGKCFRVLTEDEITESKISEYIYILENFN